MARAGKLRSGGFWSFADDLGREHRYEITGVEGDLAMIRAERRTGA